MSPRRAAAPQSPSALARWLGDQRWYTSAPGPEAGDVTLAAVPLATRPAVAVGVASVPGADADGGVDRYQLLLGGAARPTGPDLGTSPDAVGALGRFVAGGRTATGDDATVSAHWLPGEAAPGRARARTLGVEQSNTSAVIGGTHLLKVFRRLHPGTHPEVEVGRHLAAVAASGDGTRVPVPGLTGWWELDGPGEVPITLGVVHHLVPGALDGWELALGALAGDPGGLLARLHDLGATVAALHAALARPGVDDPAAFGTAPLDAGRLAEVADGVAALAAVELDPATAGPAVDGLTARREVIGDLAGSLATAVGTDAGASIRHHGDLHLGQVLLGPDGWVIVDFEGEPDRPLAERARHHSPLRDVAGMLRSIAYAAATNDAADGNRTPPGWEAAARAALLDGYLSAAPPALLPHTAPATRDLLALFELEKVVYELGYERRHRPDWQVVPARGLRALLERLGA